MKTEEIMAVLATGLATAPRRTTSSASTSSPRSTAGGIPYPRDFEIDYVRVYARE